MPWWQPGAVVINCSEDEVILEPLDGRVRVGTERARDGQTIGGSLRPRAREGVVAELRSERAGRERLMGLSARVVGRVLLAPVWMVAGGLALVAAARIVDFDRVRMFMFLDAYTLWIYSPAYVIAIAAVCFRHRTLAVVAGAVVVLHLVWIVPPMFRTVSIPAAAQHSPHLRIVSANLEFDSAVSGRAARLRELAGYDADIIVLEEVTPEWWHEIQSSGLLATHPDHAEQLGDHAGGLAILSRIPLSDVVIHPVDDWPMITATVSIDGRVVHVAGVHIVAPIQTFGQNQSQQREITDIVRKLGRPRLVAGDFNASPYNRWYGQLLGLGLHEAHEAVGRSFATTWPNGTHLVPPLRLDHVFADLSIVPLSASEGRGTGSDHRPIIVNLAVLPSR
jgi:endonuclease/exonuclease/phosphatase (EEP) superfamily protein YafD